MTDSGAPPDRAAVQQKMRAGDFAGALALLDPASPQAGSDALYLAAVCHRFLRAFDDARACLERVFAAEPEHGHALQELGHLCRDAGDSDGALRDAFCTCEIFEGERDAGSGEALSRRCEFLRVIQAE